MQILELLYHVPAHPRDVSMWAMLKSCSTLKTLVAPGFWPFRDLRALCEAARLESLVINLHGHESIDMLAHLRNLRCSCVSHL